MATKTNPKNIHATIYGRGINGHPFYSKQAWIASQAHAQQGRLNGTTGPGEAAGGGSGGPMPAPGNGGAGDPGYTGLAGIIAALSNPAGISAAQLANMQAGYTGTNGHAIGGMNGALGGLSDYAVNWLANSGLLQKNAGTTVPTTDAQGNPLTGTALLLANIQNQLTSQASPTYDLASGVTASQLGSLLQQAMGNIGQSVYAKGFGAGGAAPVATPMAT